MNPKHLISIAVLVGALLLVAQATYTVNEVEQVIITQFGRARG